MLVKWVADPEPDNPEMELEIPILGTTTGKRGLKWLQYGMGLFESLFV